MKKIIITLAALSGFFIAKNSFATCSNYTTYTSGQTLTSSSLNSLQSNYTNCINEILNGDIFTGNMYWYSGSSLFMYSDTGSTLKFGADGTNGNVTTEGQINLGTGGVVLNDDGDGALTITGAGNGSDEDFTLNLDDTSNTAVISSSTGVTSLGMNGIGMNVYSDSGSTLKAKISNDGSSVLGLNHVGSTSNCSLFISTGISIKSADGSNLSASNPCIVAIKSALSEGRPKTVYFTSNIAATSGSASDTDGNLFGITDADADQVMPFFLGVIDNGSQQHFVISRIPVYQSSNLVGGLCQRDDTDCDDESDVMILSQGLTLSSWLAMPITTVGWFRATYQSSGIEWNFATDLNGDAGFNDYYESIIFTFNHSQSGAAAGSYVYSTGTTPVFFSNAYNYQILKSGICKVYINLSGDDGTDGSGSDILNVTLPYKSAKTLISSPVMTRYVSTYSLGMASLTEGTKLFSIVNASTGSEIAVSSFANGDRYIQGSFSYTIQK